MTVTDTPLGTRCLEATRITKDYSGVPVLMGVSFTLSPGEVIGLVGHNGAGKSTLLRVLSGAHRQSGGTLRIDGEEVQFASPSDAMGRGVSTVYQELSLLPNLTVVQNVWLGRELRTRSGSLDKDAMHRRAADLVKEFGLNIDIDRRVGAYPVAVRQLLEIAIASSRDTKYLLLDEPTTALEGDQISELLSYIRQLATEKQIGVLIVNHKLDELYGVADRIIALMNGRVVIDAPTHDVDRHAVVDAIAGQDRAQRASSSTTPSATRPRERVLEVRDLTGPVLNGVSFEARSAEILGIYGLGGSGRTETLRAIAGIDPPTGGSVQIGGEEFRPRRPADSIHRGIAFLTEERTVDGIVPQMSSLLNTALPVLDQHARFGWLDGKSMRSRARGLLDELELKGDPAQPVTSLSGGNQQKVLIARALIQGPRVLLLDEPSKGVDIGAKGEIHNLLRRLAHEEGIAIVMVSSEEEEILDVADRVLVFSEGVVAAGPLPVSQLTIKQLRALAWGEAATPASPGLEQS